MPENQTVLTVKDRINLALERADKSQRDLARAMDKSSAAVSEMLNKPGPLDSMVYVEATSKLTGFTFEWLRTGEGPQTIEELRNLLSARAREIKGKLMVNEPEADTYLTGKTIRPVTVTVDQSGKDVITHVPVKAQAGYMRGYGDPKFIEKLPAFSMPMLPKGKTIRTFEVSGDSMLQLGGAGLKDGDIVFSTYVEDIFSITSRRVYVVVTPEGVTIKRVVNHLKDEDRMLIMMSDNKNGQHPNFILRPHEIFEVWEYTGHFSRNLAFNTDLWEMMNEFTTNQAKLNERMDQIEGIVKPKKLK